MEIYISFLLCFFNVINIAKSNEIKIHKGLTMKYIKSY